MKKYFQIFFFCMIFSGIRAQNFEEYWVDVDGVQLYCKKMGQGEPIIFVHGGPGLNHSYFLPHFEKLSKQNTLIFYDQRSSGKSGLSVKATMNFETFARDIDAIRQYFGLQKVHVLGHSWGSLVALKYAVQFPDHVASIILCNSIPLNKQFDEEMRKHVQVRTSAADSIRRKQILESESYKNADPDAIKSLLFLSFKMNFCDTMQLQNLAMAIPANYAVASLSYQGWTTEMRNYDFTKIAAAINCPVFIMHGQCDIIPLAASELANQLIPNSQLKVYASAGHYCFIEQTAKSNKDIRRFLKNVGNE